MSLSVRQNFLRHVYREWGAETTRRLSSYPFVDLTWHDGVMNKEDALACGWDPKTSTVESVIKESLWWPCVIHNWGLKDGGMEDGRPLRVEELWVLGPDNELSCFAFSQERRVPLLGFRMSDSEDGGVSLTPNTQSLGQAFNDSEEIRTHCKNRSSGMRELMAAFSFLKHSDLYAVEVVAPHAQSSLKRPAKTARTKPWLSRDKRIIFMEPGTKRIYEGGRVSNGTHATPLPHHRRGHWKTLRAERYHRAEDGSPRKVWTKPAWVGPMDWIDNGSEYRVLV